MKNMATLSYILVTLKSGAERDVCERVSSFEEVVQVDELYGEYDAIVKVRVEDLSQLDKFLTDKLRALPDIFLTTTMIVAKEYRHK
jgi:DNA-binding Lrp family transcriptional regulator